MLIGKPQVRISFAMASTHPLPLFALSARAAIRGAALTHTHPSLNISPLLTINAHAIRHHSMRYRDSTSAHLQSLLSALKLTKRNVSTNAGKGGSSSQSQSQSKADRHKATAPTEDEFKISFRDLGMNRVTKFVVYTVVTVLGTMETIFWCKVLVSVDLG